MMAFWEKVGHYLDSGYEASRSAISKAKDYSKYGSLLVEQKGFESKRNHLTQRLGSLVYPILATGKEALVKATDKEIVPLLKEIHDLDLLIMKKAAEIEARKKVMGDKEEEFSNTHNNTSHNQ